MKTADSFILKRAFRNRWRKMIMKEYAHYLRAKGDKKSTIQWHMEKLAIFKKWLLSTSAKNRPVTAQIILDFQSHRRTEGKSEATIAGDFRCLAAMFEWSFKEGYIASNPCEGLKRPKAPPCLEENFSPAEVTRILAKFDQSDPLATPGQSHLK